MERRARTRSRTRRLYGSWKAVVGFIVSGAALWFVFRDQDAGALIREVGQARPLPFAAGAFIATAVFWIRAWRWKALVDPVAPTSFRSRFAATTIGFMGNNVFPWRVGEVMRPLALARAESLPFVASLTTLVLERILDALTVMGLLFLSMSLPGLPGLGGSDQFADRIQRVGVVMFAALVAFVAVIVWPTLSRRIADALVARLPARFRPRARAAAHGFLDAAGALRNVHLMSRAVAWSIVLWMFNALGFWFAMRAFGLHYSYTAALFFQGILVIAVAAPSAPGFFGVYELAAAAVLVGMWGADATTSNAFAAAYHLAGYIPVTAIGLWYAHRLGVRPDVADSESTTPEPAVRVAHEGSEQ
jgi:uncharacterized protein (TIRG00374 family)